MLSYKLLVTSYKKKKISEQVDKLMSYELQVTRKKKQVFS